MSLAIWLVTLYPRAWRRRYEEEMLAVLEQHHVTLLTVLDLLFGMIKARFDPQYRDDPGPVLFTSVPRATWLALAAWGAFVVCVAISSGGIYRGMVFLFTGHRDIPWFGGGGSILTSPGNNGLADISWAVGGNLWLAVPAIVLLPFFAITALACLWCLRWAVRTRRLGAIALTGACFAAPVAIILWLIIAPPDLPGRWFVFQSPVEFGLIPSSTPNPLFLALYHFFSSFPVSVLTTLGELEALMGVVFLSVLKALQAIRKQRYGLLGLVVGIDLVLILIAVYIVKSWDLFTPITFTPNSPPDASQLNQGFFVIEALGLIAHLLPFAAIALPLLALGGNAIGSQQWHAVILGVSLLSMLIALCDVFFIVGALVTLQLGEGGIEGIPLVWAPGANNSWHIALFIPGEAFVATMMLSFLLAIWALRSMVIAASTTSSPALSAPD